MEKIKEYFETINLGDYDLDGCEISEDDFLYIAERLENSDKSLEEVVSDYLYEIREILDEGLEG